MMKCRTWVEIDAAALRHNFAALKRLLGHGTRAMAVVKSNAYGHGLAAVAKILSESDSDIWYGVDSLGEAGTLRNLGINSPVLVLGYTLREALPNVVEIGARQVVYDHNTIDALAEAAKRQAKSAAVHVKIETGTGRQGIYPEQLPEFIEHIKKVSPHVQFEGVYTHFADVEDVRNPVSNMTQIAETGFPAYGPQKFHEESYWRIQLQRFTEALKYLEDAGYDDLIRHTAASAAAILYPETHFDMVRFGIAFYGLWPSREVKKQVHDRGRVSPILETSETRPPLILKPVLSWKTRIAQIKQVPNDHPVGYGLTERVTRDTRLAVLPVGYWDGYDRGLSRIGEVLIKGKRAKVLGRVCMNMVMVDVIDMPGASVEDEAVLIGRQGAEEITADDLADKIGTINYEVVTRINPLIPRIIVQP